MRKLYPDVNSVYCTQLFAKNVSAKNNLDHYPLSYLLKNSWDDSR